MRYNSGSENLHNIDKFIKDIETLEKDKTKASLMKLANAKGSARYYCTACQNWDVLLVKHMPDIAKNIYKGTAMKDFQSFAHEYGAGHDSKWWDDNLTKAGGEEAAIGKHITFLKSHIPDIQKFASYLQAMRREIQ